MEHKYYYQDLPEGYREIHLYDVSSRRFRIMTGPVSFVISAAAAFLIFFSKIGFSFENFRLTWDPLYLLHILTVLALVLAYTVIHELTHGAVYGLFTRRKLSFGFSGLLAYCGVPGIYLKRSIAAASCIAPFAIYTAAYLIILFTLHVTPFWFAVLISFMNHLGGCFADIYAFILMMRHGKSLLMSDSGKEQRIFVKD